MATKETTTELSEESEDKDSKAKSKEKDDKSTDHKETKDKLKDTSGNELETGDMIIVFSDDISGTKTISDFLEEIIGQSESESNAEISLPKLMNSFVPMGMDPAVIVDMDEDHITASLMTLNNSRVAKATETIIEIPLENMYKISKVIGDNANSDIGKLYSDLLIYNTVRDTRILNTMLF